MIERQRPQSKVSLEDLIRLKRAERPAPEFWTEFESQLRHKQLAAIVDKRPWWRRWSGAPLARLSLPLGATAVVAFSLVFVRDQQAPATLATTVATDSIATQSTEPLLGAGESIPSRSDAPVVQVASSDAAVDERVANQNAASEGHATHPGPTLVALKPAHDISATSVRSGGEGASEPSLAQVILGLEGTTESDARPQHEEQAMPLLASLGLNENPLDQTLAAVATIQPVSETSSERDSRRARLLASVEASEYDMAGNSRLARSRERITNRLAERSLYDSISRLGLSGDSVSIKF